MKRIYLLLLMLAGCVPAMAQDYNMPLTSTPASYTVCGGNFYDNGGVSGQYTCCSFTSQVTFFPSVPGKKVRLAFSFLTVETCCDYMRIYNGPTTGSPQIGGNYNSNPGTITSTAADGSLTVTFWSDVSVVNSGWAAVISLNGTATSPITAQPGAGGGTVCLGGVGPAVSVTAGGTGNTYQWFTNGNTNSNSGGTAIAGATNASYSPSPTVLGNNYFYVRVTNCSGDQFFSNTTMINAIAKPTVASITPSSPSVCTGSPLTLNAGAVSAAAGSGSLVSYNWTGPNSFNATTTGTSTTFTPATTAAAGVYSLTVTYSTSGCTSSPAVVTSPSVTVNTPPNAIVGVSTLCPGATATLTATPSGGGWSSSNTGVATIFPGTGVATGVAAGTVTMTYSLPTTCFSTYTMTVNATPTATVTPTGATICQGNSTSFTATSNPPEMPLLDQNFNGTLAGWTVNTVGAPPSTGPWQLATAPGAASGVTGDGSQYLQAYSLGSPIAVQTTVTSPSFSTQGGFANVRLTFNQTLLSFAPPDVSASIEYSVNGGAWNGVGTGSNQIGQVINDGGTWTAANPQYTINLPAAAIGAADVRLRWVYNAQSLYWTIDNISVKGIMPANTFAWSGPGSISCASCATTTVTPTASGTATYTLATTSSAGCILNTPVNVSVNPLPNAITGSLIVCEGNTQMLASTTAGGTWTSGNTTKATIGSGTGALTGVEAGTANVTYTLLSTGCYTSAMATILSAPPAITPATASVCLNSTMTLSNTATGGAWNTSNASIATVDGSGNVTGMGVGVANITYTVPSGCLAIRAVTVNALPADIVGANAVCVGQTSDLSNATFSGTWSSNNAAIASVNSSTGLVMGEAVGNTFITYTLPTTCYKVHPVDVQPAPQPTTGAATVCQGGSTILTNTSGPGVWSSSAPSIATVNSSGVVTAGAFGGVLTISYTVNATGCVATHPFTVNSLPAMTGPSNVCKSASITLVPDVPGGTWNVSNGIVASVNTSGVVTGVNAGTTLVSYTTPMGCLNTKSVTVNAGPAAITGTNFMCEGGTTFLSNTTPSGVWISNDENIATISTDGEVAAVATSGTTTITYGIPTTGCYSTRTVSVNARPAVITGTPAVCASNGTTQLFSTPNGGTWSSGSTLIASANPSSGMITGIVAGNATITYMLPTGCFRTQAVVVNPLPANITGTLSVCEGLTTDLNNSTAGGTWSSLDAGVADVDATTGLVLGVNDGMVNIVYTLPTGCTRSRTVTVNVVPDAFSGSLSACPNQTSALSTSPAGGMWTSSAPAIAGVNGASGLVSTHMAGTARISYTMPTGCRTISNFTVNPLPASIGGVRSVCVDGQTTLTNSTTGGTWAVANTTTATIDMNSGVVNGIAQGVTQVIYELPTGCARTTNVTVNPLPAPIAGANSVCQNSTTTLTNATAGGNWVSANTTIATIGASNGTVMGVGTGVVNVSYTLPTGCRATTAIEVLPLPADITGPAVVCENSMVTMSNTTPNGTWSVDNNMVAMANMNGDITGMGAGNAVVTYTLPTGCYKTKAIVVNPLPAPIMGSNVVCQASTTTLSSATPLGTWSSSNTFVASVHPSGTVSGLNAGFSIINYTLPTGCARNTTVVVNALPEPITGIASVCAGNTITLETASTNGAWSAGSPIVTINAVGDVTGIAAGTTTVSYTNGNGCRRTRVVTVNALPGTITGNTAMCPSTTQTLSNAATGGMWSTNDAAMINIHPATGAAIATGVDGTATITYTLPTGCLRTRTLTVHPSVDAITGSNAVCKGSTTTLTTTATGGTWTSSNTAAADINAAGVVSGEGAGTATIAYVMPTGCSATMAVVVNPLPGNITGGVAVCVGSTIALGNSVAGGTWSSSVDTVGTVSAAGIVSGISAGNTMMRYELPTGCFITKEIAVNALPLTKNVTGGGAYCAGGTGVAIGVDGSQPGTLYKLMLGSTPVITTVGGGGTVDYGNQLTAGTYNVVAVTPQGCMKDMNGTAVVTINSLVTPTVTMSSDHSSTVCAGTAVTYTATGTNGGTTPTYEWSVNGTVVSSASSYTFVPANGDDVSIKFISNDACPTVASVSTATSMTVLANLAPSVTLAVGPNDSVCEGSTAIYAAAGVNGGDVPVYAWIVNGSVVAGETGSTYNYQPVNNDLVQVRLTSNYACATTNNVASNTIKMYVAKQFTPIVELTVTPGNKVQKGKEVTFTATPQNAGGTPSFQWLVNENVVAGANTAVYKTSKLNDGDSVTCIVTASAMCANLSMNSIVMEITESSTGVGVGVIANSEVRLIPNPNTGSFTVNGTLTSKANEDLTFEVTDVLGQVVFRSTSVARNGVINERIELSKTLANGMYMLNMSVGAERKAFHFVVKQ